MLTFAEFLSKRRAALGMSMTELASHLSVTPQYISLLEAAKCNPSRKLQERCATFFGEDLEYIRFLAQPMPREQKRALLRTPSALPFLSRRTKEAGPQRDSMREAIQADNEDLFIQKLFAPVENGVAHKDAPFYERLIEELFSKDDDQPRFPAKARAWAEYYQAILTAQNEGIKAARPLFESLLSTLDEDTEEPYPDILRVRTAFRLAKGLIEEQEWEQAGAVFELAATYSRLVEQTHRALEAYQQAGEAYRRIGRPDREISMYEKATATEDIPAPIKARLFVRQAQLLFNLGDVETALSPVQQAVRIWRLRSLNISDKTARLVSTQVLGLHLLVELNRREEARQWLGRIRSTLARVTEEDMSPELQRRFTAESDLESAAMMVQQGRWNHARKNLNEVEALAEAGQIEFDDPVEGRLFRQRVRLLKAAATLGQGRDQEATEFAEVVLNEPPLLDPVRQKGRHALLRARAAAILSTAGRPEDAATYRQALLAELDPDRQGSPALSELCRTPQIRAVRVRVEQALNA